MTGRLAPAALSTALLFTTPAAAQQDAEEVLHGSPAAADNYVAQSLLPTNDLWTGDLDGMEARKRIRILVPFSKPFFFIDKGKQYGVSYDIGTEFGSWLNTRIKSKKIKVSIVFIPVPRDKLFSGLAEGLGDIAAGNLTITDRRSELVDFGHPLATGAREILVTGPGAPAVTSLDDLGGQELFARPSSSYWEHLEARI